MAHSDRKNVMSKKDIAAMSKWATNRPRAEQPSITSERRALWDARIRQAKRWCDFQREICISDPP
jgi:hypothetical protein